MKKILWIIIFNFLTTNIFAGERVINLVVAYKTVYFAGHARTAIAVNNQIPAPTLHFKEGDKVTINVYNKLNEETALHWHGMLVPWQMDGVLGVSQQGIPPQGFFRYHFTVRQSGTYWYHAHAGLQEQQGLYGALLIDPLKRPNYHYNKDYVVILSDWSNTNPDQIMANLKKDGDYYSPRFPLQPSLAKFIHDYRKASAAERKSLMTDYQAMQKTRMGIYDISDVAYDAFLLNGAPQSRQSYPWTARVKVGEVVRLRFIGAGGGTIFRVKIPGATMQIVHVEGNNIKPYSVNDFEIAPGETYDVLVKIKENKPYVIYAESADTSGAAYGALITSPHQSINYKQITPFPEPIPTTREMMSIMGASSHGGGGHSSSKPITTSIATKYQSMTAAVKTNDPNQPIARVINMKLSGYMGSFIWFVDGVPEYKAKPIILDPGKRYRMIFTNVSMMHHPMHIHGHWFILRKGKGAYDPLLHTIDVPPGATMVADVDTDASGQWFFHCHLLYHMVAGMARTFQYSTLIDITQGKAKPQHIVKQTPYYNRPIVRIDEVRPIDFSLVKHPMAHHGELWFATSLSISADFFNNSQEITYKGLYGSDYKKIELFTNEAEIEKGKISNADMDIFYWQRLSEFWAVKGGLNYFYRPATSPYWQGGIGIEGTIPYFIDTDARGYYYGGSAKLDVELSRDTQITNNFFITAGIRSILASKTVTSASIGSGLNQMIYNITPYYRLMPGFNIFAEFERAQVYGDFRSIQSGGAGGSSIQNTLSLGVSMLF